MLGEAQGRDVQRGRGGERGGIGRGEVNVDGVGTGAVVL